MTGRMGSDNLIKEPEKGIIASKETRVAEDIKKKFKPAWYQEIHYAKQTVARWNPKGGYGLWQRH